MNRYLIKMRYFFCCCVIGLLFLCGYCDTAMSHPHVFVTQRVGVHFDDKGLAGFKIRWEFDEMFSSMIIDDYEKNQNRHLEAEEVTTIKNEAFSNLSNHNYFTFVRIDGDPFIVQFIKHFTAEIHQGKLVYRFLVPCHVAARTTYRHIVVATYDPTYYTSVSFANDEPAMLSNVDAFDVKSTIKRDMSISIYYDMINPWALFLDFRRQR